MKMIGQQHERIDLEWVLLATLFDRASEQRARDVIAEEWSAPIGHQREKERASGMECAMVIGHASIVWFSQHCAKQKSVSNSDPTGILL